MIFFYPAPEGLFQLGAWQPANIFANAVKDMAVGAAKVERG
jgi:hypothetical protein